jgi:hypothetical protein
MRPWAKAESTSRWWPGALCQVEGRAFVFQVSLYGFELILNQIEGWTKDRAGHGRVFIGLEESQVAALREHISTRGIKAALFHWGRPTLVIKDLDGNELFFWPPQSEWPSLEALPPLNVV